MDNIYFGIQVCVFILTYLITKIMISIILCFVIIVSIFYRNEKSDIEASLVS